MINGKKVLVVMPAYRAARTLEATFRALPHAIVDHVLLVDDASHDDTAPRLRATSAAEPAMPCIMPTASARNGGR